MVALRYRPSDEEGEPGTRVGMGSVLVRILKEGRRWKVTNLVHHLLSRKVPWEEGEVFR
jgi:hypothetical protein